jgi:hypothetical protein
LFTLLALLPLALPLGCAEQGAGKAANREKVYPASGKVTYKGAAVDGAIVKLLNTEPFKPGATGRTDAQGAFKLMTYDADDGAPAGNYIVLISKPDKPQPVPAGGGIDSNNYVPPPENVNPAPAASTAKPALPAKYNNPARSVLKAVITADGPNDSLNFELTD